MNKRVPPGTLTLIIQRAKEKYGVPSTTNIQIETIRTRVKKGNLGLAQVADNPSPLLEIEPYVLHMIDQLAKMRVPLNVSQGLRLVNSLIAGGALDSLNKWREKYSHGYQTNQRTELGLGYWRGFMKRYGHVIKAKKGVKFCFKRAE